MGEHVDPAAVAAWVEASCAQQGLDARLTDPLVVAGVCSLLAGDVGVRAAQAERPLAPARSGSGAPDGSHPGGVESLASGDGGGGDDEVFEDGLDDGGLAGEVQRLPPSA